MAFDQQTRNRLAGFVARARGLLAADFVRQLQNEYGLDPATGDMAEPDSLVGLDDARRSTARLLYDTAQHYLASADVSTPVKAKKARQEVLARIVREQAFTVLNRLAALRMAEARGLVIECIAKDYQSQGFRLYQMVAGPALGETGEVYRMFLFSLFDEFATDLAVLFDRFSPQGRLFPKERTLLDVLAEINHADIDPLWAEDETIGWIYQYFNSIEERRAMRAASSAPRNSRELAVRNQFFTPRYVVEFLTDNTLGRIWYEMTRGQTELVDRCRYLVLGRPATTSDEGRARRSATADLPARPLKDPREIRMLDPACGSMHFGLYAFDLFEVIYREAWRLEDELGYNEFERKEHSKSLHETYETEQDFLRDVPRLILENNIHGIDIDPRAAQIAGLSLWLRAQRAWKEMDLPAGARPQIRKANVVCAEPMPGERDMLEEFADSLHPKVLGALLKKIFVKMELAGDAGSLLRIEEDIKSEIEDAHKAYNSAKDKKPEAAFFDGFEPPKPAMEQSLFDFSDLDTDDDFWSTAEEKLVNALRAYAESAADGSDRKRLFAADAARGFALIDILKKRFDVVVMNPPFGEAAESSVDYFEDNYPCWTKNILCCFIIRALGLLTENGLTGAIFDRTASVKVSYEDFRRTYMIPHLRYIADTGWNVLDANVETTVHVLDKHIESRNVLCVDVRNVDSAEKGEEIFNKVRDGEKDVFACDAESFNTLPNAVIGYDFPKFLLRIFSRMKTCEGCDLIARKGSNYSAENHYRVFWDIPIASEVGPDCTFELMYNGGRYSSFIEPIRDLTISGNDARIVKYHKATIFRNLTKYYLSGVGFGKRGDYLDSHLLYSKQVFTPEGLSIPVADKSTALTLLSYLNSSLSQYTINQYCGQHKGNGYVNLLPFPLKDRTTDDRAIDIARHAYLLKLKWFQCEETALTFNVKWEDYFSAKDVHDLDTACALLEKEYAEDCTALDKLIEQNDTFWLDAAELNADDRQVVAKGVQARPHDSPWLDANEEIESAGFKAMFVRRLISYAVGRVFGRFEGDVPALSDDLFEPPFQLRGWSLGANRSGFPQIVAAEPGARNELARRVVFELSKMFKDPELEGKLAQALGVRDFGEYMLSPTGFFEDHLKLYSKSRRIAPVYWPISSASGKYVLWVYYQAVDSQTLYKCVNDFVEPRLAQAKEQVVRIKGKASRSAADDDSLDENLQMVEELEDMRSMLLDLARHWKPNLNDGIEMTAAPLWRLFKNRFLQGKLKEAWEAISNGEYEWTRHALVYFPERVVAASHHDHATAIAHDLEAELWKEVAVTRRGRTTTEWRPKELPPDELKQIVEAVKKR